MSSSALDLATPEAIARYEPVIGLEVHVQLATATKIFCGCPTSFGAPPNTNVCPVCLGMPGALPVLSRAGRRTGDQGRAGARTARSARISRFARKNYFYPDLPKGYQISQYDEPFAEHGYVDIVVDGAARRIGVTRVHMEDDAGKSIHDGFKDSDRYSYVDLNRCGTPLIEIVSEPDMRSSDEAYAYLTEVKQVLQFVEVSTCDMEKGHLRCDANVSVRLQGRGEVRHQGRGQEPELVPLPEAGARFRDRAPGGAARKRRPRRAGDAPVQSRCRRDLQHAQQGRRARLPLLPRARPGAAAHRRRVARATSRSAMPELPARKRARFIDEFGLREYDAEVLTATRAASRIFRDRRAASRAIPKTAANWVMGDLMGMLKAEGKEIADSPGQRRASGRTGAADRHRRTLRQAGQGDLPEDVRHRRRAGRHHGARRAASRSATPARWSESSTK